MCFASDNAIQPAEELKLARANVRDFTPKVLDRAKFLHTPFVAKSLRTAKFVFVRDDTLAKRPLKPRYFGPHKVVTRQWEKGTFELETAKGTDHFAIGRLKPAFISSEDESRVR